MILFPQMIKKTVFNITVQISINQVESHNNYKFLIREAKLQIDLANIQNNH